MQSTAVCIGMQLQWHAWVITSRMQRRRGEINKYSDTVEQRMILGGRNDERLTDVGTISFIPTSVSLSLLLPRTVSALISWLIYDCSDTVEWRMSLWGSNDERLTNIDTRNCYICNTLLSVRLSCMHSQIPQIICVWKRSKNREGLWPLWPLLLWVITELVSKWSTK